MIAADKMKKGAGSTLSKDAAGALLSFLQTGLQRMRRKRRIALQPHSLYLPLAQR